MIVTLQGADFSANNIGHVDVPIEISEFTLSAIAASGNNSMTDAQIQALDTFFRNIGAVANTGIFTKMDYIFLPMITLGLANSLMNYKNNTKPLTPASDKYQMLNGGLIGLSATASNNPDLIITDNEDFDLANFSLIGMAMGYKTGASAVEAYYAKVYSKTTASNRMSIYSSTNSQQQKTVYNIYGTGQTYYSKPIKEAVNSSPLPVAVSHSSSTAYSYVRNGAVVSDTAGASFYAKETGGRRIAVIGNLAGYGNINTYLPVGAILIGKALTDSELLTAYNSILALYDAFK